MNETCEFCGHPIDDNHDHQTRIVNNEKVEVCTIVTRQKEEEKAEEP